MATMTDTDEGGYSTTQPRPRLSCTPCFDALWFCYSPVHQLQQYYRLGVLDNCSQKWSSLYDCLKLKTKSSSEQQEILKARESEKHHIWSFRTPEESAAQWQEWYEHLDNPE
ncbi:uncharacterized protein LOC141605170 [Silene latifolia]|uniref:uncharacterized protein LOC141605170 n=1 Tax=Silene latifolia TaxID=37657 RepID=UPI003D785B13